MNLYSLFSILSCLYQPFCFDNSKSPSEMNLVGIPLDYSPMHEVVLVADMIDNCWEAGRLP